MGKQVEANGFATAGARREGGVVTKGWLRVSHLDAVCRLMKAKGVTWGQFRPERKSSTVMCSVVASFDSASSETYEWQREPDGSLYIEVPIEYLPEEFVELITSKAKFTSLALPVCLYKTGVLQVRAI